MKTIKKQDLISFIFSQPSEKEVNMSENYFSDNCGCLGIQYVHEKFPQVAEIALGCGFTIVDNDEGKTLMKLEEDITFFDFTPAQGINRIFSYGEIQEHLKEQGWAKPFLKNS